jgi:hypothetical protein
MMLTDDAERYCAKRGTSRVLVFNVTRFAKLVGDIPPGDVTQSDLLRFVETAKTRKLSPSTIKGTVCAMRTLIRSQGGSIAIPHVRVPPPDPKCFSPARLDAIWPHLSAWGKQHVALTFHCCFRLDDILRLQLSGVPADADVIRLQASKTQRVHSVPVTGWLRQWLGPVRIPFVSVNDWSQVIVRAELDRCCDLAGVSRILPSDIRKAGITAWGQANGMAGEIIHGCGLSGIMRHYIDRMSVLQSAAPRVRLPQCFGATDTTGEESLLASFRRLDPAAQGLIAETAERLAAV